MNSKAAADWLPRGANPAIGHSAGFSSGISIEVNLRGSAYAASQSPNGSGAGPRAKGASDSLMIALNAG